MNPGAAERKSWRSQMNPGAATHNQMHLPMKMELRPGSLRRVSRHRHMDGATGNIRGQYLRSLDIPTRRVIAIANRVIKKNSPDSLRRNYPIERKRVPDAETKSTWIVTSVSHVEGRTAANMVLSTVPKIPNGVCTVI